jgi:hypothetical protein
VTYESVVEVGSAASSDDLSFPLGSISDRSRKDTLECPLDSRRSVTAIASDAVAVKIAYEPVPNLLSTCNGM